MTGIFDEDLIVSTVTSLKHMQPVTLHPYDYATQARFVRTEEGLCCRDYSLSRKHS